MFDDTICAIATSLSESSIGIVRISGKDAISIVNGIYVNKSGKKVLSEYKSHTIHYGFIEDENEVIDEVMVSIMKGPNSFTREDVVEINCHGGVFVCKKVLKAVLKNGARLSEPGEFTKRAFLNGRIDLSKAEAVMDVISSSNSLSLKNSLKHLNGKLFDTIKKLREEIIFEIAFIESALDDPEHISLDGYPEKLMEKIKGFKQVSEYLLESFNRGKVLKSGINTVIVGKPNVGKSSLLNLLTGEERAIVTEVAGTTRDVIEQQVSLRNITLNLVDTAGIRQTDDLVENIGVERARKYAKDADFILFLIDASVDLSKEDSEIYELIKDKKTLILLNKIDIGSKVTKESIFSFFDIRDLSVIEISAKEGSGIEELEKYVESEFLKGSLKTDDEIVITNVRQAEELRKTAESLSLVEKSIISGLPEDFYSIDLMNAYTSLGKIIGEDIDDDLVNEIFSKFCMGK